MQIRYIIELYSKQAETFPDWHFSSGFNIHHKEIISISLGFLCPQKRKDKNKTVFHFNKNVNINFILFIRFACTSAHTQTPKHGKAHWYCIDKLSTRRHGYVSKREESIRTRWLAMLSMTLLFKRSLKVNKEKVIFGVSRCAS